jgi:hypothetical protein
MTPNGLTITLCGSTKYPWAWEEMNARLTMEGFIVLSVGCLGHALGLNHDASSPMKAALDELHLLKITMSQFVYMLDVDGYIGPSAQKELAHAKLLGKPIRYLSQELPDLRPETCLYSLSARAVR